MTKRFFSPWPVLLPLLLTSCVSLRPAAVGNSMRLVIYPKLNRSTQVVLNPLDHIASLSIVPYIQVTPGVYSPISALTGEPTEDTGVMVHYTQASPSISADSPFVISSLRSNTSYRIFGRAYDVHNQLISQDNLSFVDVAIAQDDAPKVAALPIYASIPVVFSATTSVTLNVTGRFDYVQTSLYMLAGNTQVSLGKTRLTHSVVMLENLQGNTVYRFVAEGYKLGGPVASQSLDIAVGNDTELATSSLTLDVPYVLKTIAGGTFGSQDGTGTEAFFKSPYSLALDTSGWLYIVDTNNHAIRKLSPEGVVTTFAGSMGSSGSQDGTGTDARFNGPEGIALDPSGNVYVADTCNHRIRKITPQGVVSTLAGSNNGAEDGTGTAAKFLYPWGIAFDNAGEFYLSDYGNHAIRKVSAQGVVTTLAGSLGNSGAIDDTGTLARFYHPCSLAVDAQKNVYVADSNQAIRKVTPQGVVTTFAGFMGSSGSQNGAGTLARFQYPQGVAVDAYGNVFVAEIGNNLIRKVTPDGVVSTVLGSPLNAHSSDGTGSAAGCIGSSGITLDLDGNLYISDNANNRIRKAY